MQTLVSPLYLRLLDLSCWGRVVGCHAFGAPSLQLNRFIERRNEVAAKLSLPGLCEQQVLPDPRPFGEDFCFREDLCLQPFVFGLSDHDVKSCRFALIASFTRRFVSLLE